MPRKYISILHNFLILRCCRCLKSFPLENKDPFILHGQCCLWPGKARIQGINSYGIDLVIQQYSAFCAKRLLSTLKSIYGLTMKKRLDISMQWPLPFPEVSPIDNSAEPLAGRMLTIVYIALQWSHNERHGISNHRCLECLLTRLFRRTSKKTSKLHWALWGNPPVTGGFPSQRASNAENVPIWWRHHGTLNANMLMCTKRSAITIT